MNKGLLGQAFVTKLIIAVISGLLTKMPLLQNYLEILFSVKH